VVAGKGRRMEEDTVTILVEGMEVEADEEDLFGIRLACGGANAAVMTGVSSRVVKTRYRIRLPIVIVLGYRIFVMAFYFL